MADFLRKEWSSELGAYIDIRYTQLPDGSHAPAVHDAALAALMGGAGCYAAANYQPIAGAYSAADIQDTAKAFTWYYANGVVVPATAIVRVVSTRMTINLTAVPSTQTSFTLALFKAARATPLADNNAWSLPAAEIDNYMDKLSLGAPVVVGSILHVRQSTLSYDYQMLASGMVGELITDAGYTAGATPPAHSVKLLGVVL